MAKAKVVVTIAGDAYKIAQNIWKAISGSAHVKRIPSNSAAAKNAKNLSSTNAAKTKINTARLKIGSERKKTADALRQANKKTEKIKFKKEGPLDAGKKTKRKKTNDKKQKEPEVKSEVSQAQRLRDADVTKGTKITSKNVVSGNIAKRGAKRLGEVITKGGKKFIKTKTGKLIAIGGGLAGVHYIGKKIDQSLAGTSGAATTSSGTATTSSGTATTIKPKPPKPSGPVTTAPAPPSQLPSSSNGKKSKPLGRPTGPPQRRPIKAAPKTLEQKLKDKWVKSRGGEEAFGKRGSDASWKTHVLNMREGSEAGLTYTDQQNYEKIMEERKGATKKKYGGIIKRNKGGAVRGVGKALRGYGNNSIYSNKMY